VGQAEKHGKSISVGVFEEICPGPISHLIFNFRGAIFSHAEVNPADVKRGTSDSRDGPDL